MKTEILRLLRERSGYVSGQELCERFGVSRTAVWKAVKQLKEEGCRIEAVQNRGYCLKEAAEVFTKAGLESRMEGSWAGRRVEFYQEVDSTNIRAKQLAEGGAPHGTLVVAESQTAGRGRRGRNWTSPEGTGIWMSLLMRPQIPPASASMVTLVAAMAVAVGIRESTGINTLIKWPNDIVAGGKKVCGILTEMSAEIEEIHYVVTGIGINANIPSFPGELKETATSLYLEKGGAVERSAVIVSVMKAMETYYDKFISNGDLSSLAEEYNSLLVNRDRRVRVLDPRGEYGGVALGIDRKGELLVRRETGEVSRVVSGEVSVRGVYGYV